MIVTFIGHRDACIDDVIKQRFVDKITECAEQGPIECLIGRHGTFDFFCTKTLFSLREHLPIKVVFVTPYLTKEYQQELKEIQRWEHYDDIIYPELERVPVRYAIIKRNEYMIDCADMLITYCWRQWGGTARMVKYAKRKKKEIINIIDK